MNEDQFIASFFKPLTQQAREARALEDDAAVFSAGGQTFVITTDTIAEGTHFFPGTAPESIAQQLWRVNLSDLAGKGAEPLGFFLNLSVPRAILKNEHWMRAFTDAIAKELERWGGALWGGNTIALETAKVFSLTAIGTSALESPPSRNGAKPGDLILVSGTLGDAALAFKNHSPLPPGEGLGVRESVERKEKYCRLPTPRLRLGKALAPMASAMMDISDGLVKDLKRICHASECGAEIQVENLPIGCGADDELALGGGEDYELLITLPKEKLLEAKNCAKALGETLTEIGKITQASDVTLKKNGQEYRVKHEGFDHLL